MDMGILIHLFISGIAVFLTAYLLPGVKVDSFLSALLVAIVLGVVNAVIKPILKVLTFPITLLTLGLFSLVINALMIMLTDALVKGFQVDGFWWAVLFSIVLSIISSVLFNFTDRS